MMKRLRRTAPWAAYVALALAAHSARAAELKAPDSSATPAELVTVALQTELDGPSEQRKLLLHRALKLDSDYAPARWQSGYLRWDDQWLTLDELAARVKDDPQLAAYRQRRGPSCRPVEIGARCRAGLCGK